MRNTLTLVCVLAACALQLHAQNVGIGTADPESRLDVAGDISADSIWISRDSASEAGVFIESGASVIEQTRWNASFLSSGNGVWQSFTAIADGNQVRLSVYYHAQPQVTLIRLYAGEGTSGTELASATVAQARTGWQSMPQLVAEVDSGSVYTIWMDRIEGLANSGADPYPGGRCGFSTTCDIRFRVSISTATPVEVHGNGSHTMTLRGVDSRLDVQGAITGMRGSFESGLGIGTSATDYLLTIGLRPFGDSRLLAFRDLSGTVQWKWDLVYSDLRLGSNTIPEVITVKQNGHVGIGSSSPTHRLDARISGTHATVAQFSTLGGKADILIHNQARHLAMGVNDDVAYLNTSGDDLQFQAGELAQLFIESQNGHVGIGTNTPQYRFDVFKDESDIIIAGFRTSGGYGEIHAGNSTHTLNMGGNTVGCFVGTYSNSDLRLRTGNDVRLTIRQANGFIGIGNEDPGARLDVNGDIKLSGVIQNEPVSGPVLLNQWVNYNDGFEAAGYYKDKEGLVHLSGLVKWGTAAHVMTLPGGYRPALTQMFTVVSGGGFARLDVQSNGTVTLVGSYNNAYVSLSGITFRAGG